MQTLIQTQRFEHVHEVNAGRGFVRVRKVNALGCAHGGMQFGACLDFGVWCAAAHGYTGFDQAQGTCAARQDMAGEDQLLDQGFGQDDHIAGCTRQKFVAHHADRTERALNLACGELFEFGLNALDHGCGCAAT